MGWKVKVFLIVSLVVLGYIFWRTWPSNNPRVVFCNVGQGDGILIQSGTVEILVDTGPENGGMLRCLSKYLPFWDKRLEAVILTHEDADHAGGWKQIQKYYSTTNFYSGNLRAGDVISYNEMTLDVLSPGEITGNDNEDSVVSLLNIGGKKFLMMGDVTAETEQRLVWRGILRQGFGILNVLKVSHHGSGEATSEELLQAIKPEEAVVSVGKNSFGHPNKIVLERLEKYGVKIRRTDEVGDIEYNLKFENFK